MDLSRYFSIRRRQRSRDTQGVERENIQSYLPLLASPINEDAREALSNRASDVEKLTIAMGTAESLATTILAGNGRTSSGNIVIYKPHHEASTVELFYDLFFVANLAYFTAMHQHTDAQSLVNYLKLFTLLWFTWLSTTLFDVRFSFDSVWYRLHKAVQFGVFTGFVFAGPVFDKYSNSYDGESYRHFAIVLVVSRCCIAVQYGVVMWQGRMFRQTLLPLGLSTAVHLAAAAAYAVTLVFFPKGLVGLEEQVAWVVIAIVEGLTVLLIAMTWRIVSFKYTHIVERLQLLTLIIIGEGIIGMIKSVACITKGQAKNNATELGSVIAAVVLLYLVYMLYFDQFSEDRFGTLRQQIWSLLHYPLHMAIVICVEGNTALIVWNSAVQALVFIWTLECEDYFDPADGFDTSTAYIAYINQSMFSINNRFRSKKWDRTYDWNLNLTAINDYTTTYGFKTDEWNNKTGDLVRSLFTKAQVFVFEAHADTLAKLNAVSPGPTAAQQPSATKLEAIYDVFNVTVMSFYISAGAMLLVLAILYWFNKMHKTKYEFGEMINRVVMGFALIIVGVATVVGDKSTVGFKFKASHWMIAIVVLCFVAVLFLDNVLLALSRKTLRRNARRGASWGNSTTSTMDMSTVNLLPQYPHSRNLSRSPSRSAPLSRVTSTANMPLSRTQTRISAPESFNWTSEHDHGRSDVARTQHKVVDFADHAASHIPCRSLGDTSDIGLAISPPLPPRAPSRDLNKSRKGKERARVYESVDWSDEQGSDVEDVRCLGRRARTS
ncbi:uncharacterized protein EKO05_0000891 [Ascochyta rabiei]|uniref:uncharacterized protein n=1 Tax=Didymella rabiei TaxID=5454 RepID=UPI0022051F47|nr:uncharacterized protein EKO05_0000891 [Ascochyta rabiei]UPX10221.1 hypothetical protein EKO05_0000891 [Ascochyta rabiei]